MKNIFVVFAFSIFLFGCSSVNIENKIDNCDLIEFEIRNLFDQANYCEVDLDCVVLETNFKHKLNIAGCNQYHLGNKSANLSSINQQGDKFRKSGCPTVQYFICESPPLEEIKCIEGKCVDTRFN